MRCGENGTILDLLRARAERAPEAVAIRAPGRRSLTYGELLGQVESVVTFLNVRGIYRSDRIAIVLPNGPEMAVAFLGVAAGAVCAPLNPAYSRSEFEFYLSDLNPKALIVQSGMNTAATRVAQEHDIPIIEVLPNSEGAAGTFRLRGKWAAANFSGHSACKRCRADPTYLGDNVTPPKLVPLTHANLLPQLAISQLLYDWPKKIAASTSCRCFIFMGWSERYFHRSSPVPA